MNILRKVSLLGILFTCFTLTIQGSSSAEKDQPLTERLLILREARETEKSTAAVEAHLIDNIMEVKITARMYGTKPKIYNTFVEGSRLGRLSIESKEILLSTVEDEEPYPTTKRGAFISFSGRTKTKKSEGTLTRELVEFKIPSDKVVQDKRYLLWVQTESLQRGGKVKTFKFELEDFYERLKESKAIAALNNISKACEGFRSVQTPLTYPPSLSELIPYIDADLADTTTPEKAKRHYYYTYTKVNEDEFTCTATPVENEEEIMRIFFLDESGIIKLNDTNGLPLNKIPLP